MSSIFKIVKMVTVIPAFHEHYEEILKKDFEVCLALELDSERVSLKKNVAKESILSHINMLGIDCKVIFQPYSIHYNILFKTQMDYDLFCMTSTTNSENIIDGYGLVASRDHLRSILDNSKKNLVTPKRSFAFQSRVKQ